MTRSPLALTRAALAVLACTLLAAACETARRTTGEWPWYSFEAPDHSFRVLFPESRPLIRHLVEGDRRRTDYSSRQGMTTFMVQVFEGDRYRPADAERLLADYPNPRAAGISGRVVSESRLRMGRYPGREVQIEGTVKAAPGLVVQILRAYVADSRMFVVHAGAAPGRPLSAEAPRFLDSFKILR